METLAGMIGAYLATSHTTKKDLAKRLNVTPETLNNKLEGRTAITIKEARSIAQIIGKTLDEVCAVAP